MLKSELPIDELLVGLLKYNPDSLFDPEEIDCRGLDLYHSLERYVMPLVNSPKIVSIFFAANMAREYDSIASHFASNYVAPIPDPFNSFDDYTEEPRAYCRKSCKELPTLEDNSVLVLCLSGKHIHLYDIGVIY